MALFSVLHMYDVSHQVTWIETFSKLPWIKHKKNCRIFGFHLFAHLGFFNLKGMYWDKKKGEKFAISYPLILVVVHSTGN